MSKEYCRACGAELTAEEQPVKIETFGVDDFRALFGHDPDPHLPYRPRHSSPYIAYFPNGVVTIMADLDDRGSIVVSYQENDGSRHHSRQFADSAEISRMAYQYFLGMVELLQAQHPAKEHEHQWWLVREMQDHDAKDPTGHVSQYQLKSGPALICVYPQGQITLSASINDLNDITVTRFDVRDTADLTSRSWPDDGAYYSYARAYFDGLVAATKASARYERIVKTSNGE